MKSVKDVSIYIAALVFGYAIGYLLGVETYGLFFSQNELINSYGGYELLGPVGALIGALLSYVAAYKNLHQ